MKEPEYSNQQQRTTRHPFLKFFVVMIFLILFGSGSAVLWIYNYSRTLGPGGGPAEVVVTIPQGSSFRQITGILADSGLIHEDIRFGLIARYLGLSANVQAGEFRLSTLQKPVEVLRELINAKPVQHPVGAGC